MNDVSPFLGDEYGGATLADVALAVGYAADEKERDAAIAAFMRRLPTGVGQTEPGIGHNSAPLGELLEEELQPFRKRRDDLVRVAETSVITDAESAAKVLDLAQLCKAFETEIDERRKTLVKPYVEAQRRINDSHNRLRLDVQIARQGINGVSGLRGMLTEWDDKQKAAAAEAAEKARREAKAREIAAESARQKAAEAAAAAGGRGAVSAELAAMRAAEEADIATRKAEAIRPEPVRGHMGQVSRKREIRFDVTDAVACATWLAQQPGLQNNLHAALMTIIGQHLRALGVEGVAAGVEIPGVNVRVEQGAAHVRR
jgi:hypothetical protein